MKRVSLKEKLGRMILGSFLVASLAACASAPSVLPEERSFVQTPFTTYQEAYEAYDNVRLAETTKGQLFTTGYDFATLPNVKELSYLDLIETFMPRDNVTFDDLDPKLRACLKARASCKGYLLQPSHIELDRVGSVMLDVLNFRRTEVTSGWQAQALFVMHNDVVVYKLWSGTQNVSETRQQTNPLGPFQNLGGAFTAAAKSAF